MAELTKAIERFLALDYGDGCGSGDGSGDGYCFDYGSGDGSGDGCGSGYGDGSGDGCGYGYGDGIKSFNDHTVYIIDYVPTIIEKIHLNLAKGFIVNSDLTTSPCFIAKGQNKFAHGATRAEARKALEAKIFEDLNPEEKIEMFLNEFKLGVKYPARAFYEWHHKLTGSCEFGRNAFIRNHGIDLECGTYTVEEFIQYTKNDYGGEIIRQLEECLA